MEYLATAQEEGRLEQCFPDVRSHLENIQNADSDSAGGSGVGGSPEVPLI